jgi:hypothetical protein
MKRPHQEIQSTIQWQSQPPTSEQQVPIVQAAPVADDESWMGDLSKPSFHVEQFKQGPNVIVADNDSSVGNIFCFGVFADKRTSVLYNNFTRTFP